jgi:beta-glucosidase
MAPRRLAIAMAALMAGALLPLPAAPAELFPWMNKALPPERRAGLLIRSMTLDQKMQQMVGGPGQVPEIPSCYGARHVPGIPALLIPTLRITNGPVGVGQNDCVPKEAVTPGKPFAMLGSRLSAKATQLPSAMAVAASFDTKVAARFGDVIGIESRALALHVLEGPGVNLARIPQLGRNFEYFGEDPMLSGTMAVEEIKAIQAHGVMAMAKHLVANEQETNRHTVNEVIDDRVLHELYLLPFEMAVRAAGVASVMCSYNSVNGHYMCENKHILTDVLRDLWGFRGYVQSDFFATHNVVATLLSGMDHEMPGLLISSERTRQEGPWFTPANLNAALAANQISVSHIDRALVRRYTQMFKFGIFDRPVAQAPVDVNRGGQMARAIGEESAVLLKNAGNLLPFDAKAVRTVALIGQPDYAAKAVAGCCGGSSDVIPFYTVTPLQGIQNALNELGSSAKASLTVVKTDLSNLAEAIAAAKSSDVAIVLAGTIAEEGADRASIALSDGQDAMITAVAAANARTAIVLKDNASTLLPWINQVPAVLEAWFPGQEDGNIVARLLFGLATPSGKLPVTFPKLETDVPASTPKQYPGVDGQGKRVTNNNVPTTVEYSEGLEIGYRWYDSKSVEPLFPFGHGLSYTTFEISNLTVTPHRCNGVKPVKVQFFVQNTGKRRGGEVPQVYLGMPASLGEPPKRLIGFAKVWLNPGERKKIEITIDPKAANHPLGCWDSGAQKWDVREGQYTIFVGKSSGDIKLRAILNVGNKRERNR